MARVYNPPMAEWWWAYLALGAFVGFFSGMLGIGGGAASVPVLAFVFAAQSFTPDHVVHLALGTGISMMLFTSVTATLSHHRRRSVNWRAFRAMAAGILAGAFAGALLAGRLDVRLLSIAFTALIFYFSFQMFRAQDARPTGVLPGVGPMAGFGVFIGVVSSLTATGGASLVVPFLVKRNVPVHEAIGTAAAVGWPIAAAGAAGYAIAGWSVPGLPPYSAGYVYLPALFAVVAASMLMAPVGAAVAHRTAGRTLKRVFAIVLFTLATTMLLKFL